MRCEIITLFGHKLSEKLARDCIDQAEKFNIKPKKFKAIWGKDYKQHLAHLGLFLGRAKVGKMSLAHYGNFLSHYYLWLKCIEINEPLIILEHDGYMIRPMPDNILDIFPDVLKLDRFNPYERDYNELIEKSLNEPFTVKPIEKIKKKKCGYYTWGSYAYIIKPIGAYKLVEYIKSNGFLPTDNQIASGVVDIYTCTTPVARLHPLFAENKDNITILSTSREMGMPDDV